MKSCSASADIAPMMKTKKPNNKYFNPRSGTSTQRGNAALVPNSLRPSFHKYSDSVPTGHSHEQNAFFNTRLIPTNAINSTMAAG